MFSEVLNDNTSGQSRRQSWLCHSRYIVDSESGLMRPHKQHVTLRCSQCRLHVKTAANNDALTDTQHANVHVDNVHACTIAHGLYTYAPSPIQILLRAAWLNNYNERTTGVNSNLPVTFVHGRNQLRSSWSTCISWLIT